MTKTYKVDLDYEASLFDPNYLEDSPSNLKIIKEFEYVFFLINKEDVTLKNVSTYEQTYIEKLKTLGFIIPAFSPKSSQYDFWWGYHHNRELEKKLNSKLTSALIAQENKWGFSEGEIVENYDQLINHLKKFQHVKKWIIKRPNGFSGIGHFQFSTDAIDVSALGKILTGKVLLEPVYDRVFDIGTTFIIEDGKIINHFMVENFNSVAGAFKGGAGCSDVDKFKKYIFKKYNYSLDLLEKYAFEIAKVYLDLGAISNIQIDSFIYRSGTADNNLQLYALVEVNYRKSMGLVIHSLAQKNSEADWIEWKIENAKSIKTNPLDPDWIMISPVGNHFQSFYKLKYFL